MGMVKEIQTVLDNITHDMVAAGTCSRCIVEEVREEAEAVGVSDYFINQYVKNLKEEMYDG
jgi:hypothetical protein